MIENSYHGGVTVAYNEHDKLWEAHFPDGSIVGYESKEDLEEALDMFDLEKNSDM